MIYIVLPSFNEEKGLPLVLEKIREISSKAAEFYRVVVVDDGSRDRTSEIARSFSGKLDMHVITFEHNRGVAEVFRQGFEFVVRNSASPAEDILIVLDSDNTQDPDVMRVMIEKIHSGQDLVIASRFEGEGRMIGCPWPRLALSLAVSWLLRFLIQLPHVKDYSTFYRAYRVSLLRSGIEKYGSDLFEGKGFAVAAGLLIKLGNITDKISEVPLVLRYDLKGGQSGMKIFKTIKGYLQLMAQYIMTGGFRRMRRASVS